MKILGISGSLRNARYGRGSDLLVKEIKQIDNIADLKSYLKKQTQIRAQDFLQAGEAHGLPFDKIYKNLLKAKGKKGLSNSEAALVAGLWGADQEGADIEHIGLSRYFPMNGQSKNLDELKTIVLGCDALLVSGPVYFGDRGSLVQSFVEYVYADPLLREHCKGKIYSGIAVGAKRNGGQETQLIYQLIDMANLNMLAVGNSAETTSQYGGTVLAGDVGTAWADDYGLDTAIGAGQRLARVAIAKLESKNFHLADKVKIGIWLVQDTADKQGLKHINKFVNSLESEEAEFKIIDVTDDVVARCIACDLCPTHHAPRDEYACIIKIKNDFFLKKHKDLMDADAILLAAYSPIDRSNIYSVYQKFIERTRYIRRGSYMLSDRLVAPLVISELNANQNLHIRILTSLIRHHTILHHPVIAVAHENVIINLDFVHAQLESFIKYASELTVARLTHDIKMLKTHYNPIGYEISSERNKEDMLEGVLDNVLNKKEKESIAERTERLITREVR